MWVDSVSKIQKKAELILFERPGFGRIFHVTFTSSTFWDSASYCITLRSLKCSLPLPYSLTTSDTVLVSRHFSSPLSSRAVKWICQGRRRDTHITWHREMRNWGKVKNWIYVLLASVMKVKPTLLEWSVNTLGERRVEKRIKAFAAKHGKRGWDDKWASCLVLNHLLLSSSFPLPSHTLLTSSPHHHVSHFFWEA